MKLTLSLLLFTLMLGCSSTPPTEAELFEREYNRSAARENWMLCERVLRRHNRLVVHDNHSHQKGRPARHHEIKSDLLVNRCRQIIGKERWAQDL